MKACPHSFAVLLCCTLAVTSCGDGGGGAAYDTLDPRRGLAGGQLQKAYFVDRPLNDDFAWDRAAGWDQSGNVIRGTATHHNPLWLSAPLPDQVRVEVEVSSPDPLGEFRFEFAGNGRNHESGYVLVYGAWSQSLALISRLDEHEASRAEAPLARPIEADHHYKMTFVRTDGELRWFVDGELVTSYRDPEPLRGTHHRFFGINTWTSTVEVHAIVVYMVQP